MLSITMNIHNTILDLIIKTGYVNSSLANVVNMTNNSIDIEGVRLTYKNLKEKYNMDVDREKPFKMIEDRNTEKLKYLEDTMKKINIAK